MILASAASASKSEIGVGVHAIERTGGQADTGRRGRPHHRLGLKTRLEGAGAVVIGPASSLDKALQLAQEVALDGAVLDVRLEHGDTRPLAVRLVGRRVPFLFQTSDPGVVAGLFPDVPILRKPFRSEHLIASLAELLAKS